ncbi:MAG: GNAT family N-acetyltransferase [Candidatus Thorarchaeota archaeon]
MTHEDIQIIEYSREHAKSISEHLFEGVPEEIVQSQREELLKPGPEEVFSVCALHGGEVVGVCTGVRMRWAGARHRIEMVQVVVHESFRGQGVARRMMQSIAAHFSTLGIEIIQISAEAGNVEAMKAYKRIGFKRFGTLHHGLKYDNEYGDEVMMAARIAAIL